MFETLFISSAVGMAIFATYNFFFHVLPFHETISTISTISPLILHLNPVDLMGIPEVAHTIHLAQIGPAEATRLSLDFLNVEVPKTEISKLNIPLTSIVEQQIKDQMRLIFELKLELLQVSKGDAETLKKLNLVEGTKQLNSYINYILDELSDNRITLRKLVEKSHKLKYTEQELEIFRVMFQLEKNNGRLAELYNFQEFCKDNANNVTLCSEEFKRIKLVIPNSQKHHVVSARFFSNIAGRRMNVIIESQDKHHDVLLAQLVDFYNITQEMRKD